MSLESNDSCPNCRVAASGAVPCYALREIVASMLVQCPECTEDDGGRKRRRVDNDNDGVQSALVQSDWCTWTGPLKDMGEHEKVCEYKTIKCSFDGCEHECKRKDMNSHLSGTGMPMHMNLMRQSIEGKYATCEKKIKDVEERCNKKITALQMEMLNGKYVNDRRSWVEYKPDALFDFKVYPFRKSGYDNKIAGLLCEIPGPLDSVWEGAKIPMILTYSWSVHKPPKCRFPAGFFHPNIYPSGTVSVSSINEEEGWTDGTTLPEILFSVQQLLSHPNFSSPAQMDAYATFRDRGIDDYNNRVKEEVKVYLGCAKENPKVDNMLPENVEVDKLEATEEADGLGALSFGAATLPRERPNPPPFETDENGEAKRSGIVSCRESCRCSCCAWGQVFWDNKKRMRFLFGIGG